jgi:5,10-methylenetetrahydromethanopterin reductase
VGVVSAAPLLTGVWFQGGLRVGAAVELAVQAEAADVDSVWVAEGPVARDAFVTLSAIAAATSRVELATGVVNPFTRHPAQLAASFATLDELSGGRAVCGVGIGARDFLIPLGADVAKPLTTAREMLSILRRLLAREVVDLDGTKFQLDAVRLGFRPPRGDIPIFLAATGPRMCGLAGREADGIYLLYGTR